MPPIVSQMLLYVIAGFLFGLGFHFAGRLINKK